MPFINLGTGDDLILTIPTNGTQNWGTNYKLNFAQKIVDHDHTGTGNGNFITTGAIADAAVTDAKILLRNDNYLLGRNNAGLGNINIIKVDTNDELTFGAQLNLRDSLTAVVDEGDVTKKAVFSLGGATTGKTATIVSSHTDNRTLTLPDATDTLIGKATTDVLTNKSYDADGTGNALTNVEDANIKAGAAIAVAKLAAGTNDYVLKTVAGTPAWAINVAAGAATPFNWMINAQNKIMQRDDGAGAAAIVLDAAVVASTTATYYIDRTKTLFSGVTANHQYLSSSQPSALAESYSYKMVASSSTTGQLGFTEIVEDFGLLAGVEVTFSQYIKSNSTDARLYIDDGVSVTQSTAHTGGGAWERLTVTKTLSASNTKCECHASIYDSGTVSITSGDYIEGTGRKLEIGSTATTCESLPISIDLERSRRYYQTSLEYGNYSYSVPSEYLQRSNNAVVTTQLPAFRFEVEMNAEPTVTLYRIVNGLAGSVYRVSDAGSSTATPTVVGSKGVGYIALGTAGQNNYNFNWKAVAEL
jgi:hypothetical protein